MNEDTKLMNEDTVLVNLLIRYKLFLGAEI